MTLPTTRPTFRITLGPMALPLGIQAKQQGFAALNLVTMKEHEALMHSVNMLAMHGLIEEAVYNDVRNRICDRVMANVGVVQ